MRLVPALSPSPDSQASYEKLADAFNGLLVDSLSDAPPELNRLEAYLHQQVVGVMDGHAPVDTLPIMPATANALLSRISDTTLDPSDLLAYLYEDPSIAAEVIKLANSGYLRRTLMPVNNLHLAVQALDPQDLKAMLSAVVLRPAIQIKPIHFRLVGKPLWQHCRNSAQACASVAQTENVDRATAYLMGLVHDIGKIVMFKLLCASYRATGSIMSPRPEILAELVRRYASGLTQVVLKHWHFAEMYSVAVADQSLSTEAMTPLGRVLRMGSLLAEALLILQKESFSRATMEEVMDRFGIPLAQVYAVFPFAPRAQVR
jgi:HD-like signal output (HDOD) protein